MTRTGTGASATILPVAAGAIYLGLAASAAFGRPPGAQAAGSGSGPSSQPASQSVDGAASAGPEATTSWPWVDGCHVLRPHTYERTRTGASLLLTYQEQVAMGGHDAGIDRGAFAYWLSVKQDLWNGAWATVFGEGGSGKGLSPVIGDLLGTNDVAGEPDCTFVSRYYLRQDLFDKKVRLVLGKIDLTDFFDANAVADCEITRFLAQPLVNNVTVPWPKVGLAAAAKVSPADWLYLQAGVGDSRAEPGQAGFTTAFHNEGEDHTFSIYEAGLSPKIRGREGNYRFLFWYDPHPPQRFDGSGTWRDDTGFGLSFDQEITRRITLFARYGFAHGQVRRISNMWSLGARLAEPIPGRRKDILGAAMAQGLLSHDFRRAQDAAAQETIFEVYYSLPIGRHIIVLPDLQVLLNPSPAGHPSGTRPDVIGGIRLVVFW